MKTTITTTQEVQLSITDIVNAITYANGEEKDLLFDTLVKTFPLDLLRGFELTQSDTILPALISRFKSNEDWKEELYATLDAEALEGIADINGCTQELLELLKEATNEELNDEEVAEYFSNMRSSEAADLLIEIAQDKGVEDKVAKELMDCDSVSAYIADCDDASFRLIITNR